MQRKDEAWKRLGLCLIQGLADPDDRGLEADTTRTAQQEQQQQQEGEGPVVKGVRRRVSLWMGNVCCVI